MTISFGERFKELRSEKQKNQQELIEDFNNRYHYAFTRVAVSQYETNKRIPEIEALKSFADYFGVSIDYLLGTSDIRNITPQKKQTSEEVETIAAHLEAKGKDITPHKMKMIKRYIDDLFDEEF